mmetsp:Transcript_60993/g.115003  ORF Transcript_60993/g.115003 Transcript_60993/m.115003 type:complete len:472 (-) Transcript_60993:66-1481(-)
MEAALPCDSDYPHYAQEDWGRAGSQPRLAATLVKDFNGLLKRLAEAEDAETKARNAAAKKQSQHEAMEREVTDLEQQLFKMSADADEEAKRRQELQRQLEECRRRERATSEERDALLQRLSDTEEELDKQRAINHVSLRQASENCKELEALRQRVASAEEIARQKTEVLGRMQKRMAGVADEKRALLQQLRGMEDELSWRGGRTHRRRAASVGSRPEARHKMLLDDVLGRKQLQHEMLDVVQTAAESMDIMTLGNAAQQPDTVDDGAETMCMESALWRELEGELRSERELVSQLVHTKVRHAQALQRADCMEVLLAYYEEQLRRLDPTFRFFDIDAFERCTAPFSASATRHPALEEGLESAAETDEGHVSDTSTERDDEHQRKGRRLQSSLKKMRQIFRQRRPHREHNAGVQTLPTPCQGPELDNNGSSSGESLARKDEQVTSTASTTVDGESIADQGRQALPRWKLRHDW